MKISDEQKNVFAEAYVILKYLKPEEYSKIPKEVLSAIEENRNKDYEYYMNEEVDIEKQPMMEETRALLFNIYKDYLATLEEKIMIEKELQRKRDESNLLKKQQYNPDDIFKAKEKNKQPDQLPAVKKENIIKKIISKIKSIFTNKS